MERRKVFFYDLDCYVHQILSDDGKLADRDVFTIIYKSMYHLDGSCPKMLIDLVKHLITSFIDGDTSAFLELEVEGVKCYRFSNDANLAMCFIPLKNNGEYLMSLMPATEMGKDNY